MVTYSVIQVHDSAATKILSKIHQIMCAEDSFQSEHYQSTYMCKVLFENDTIKKHRNSKYC